MVGVSSGWARALVLPWFFFHSSLAARPLTPPTASTIADPVGASATIEGSGRHRPLNGVRGCTGAVPCSEARMGGDNAVRGGTRSVPCSEARNGREWFPFTLT